MLAARRVGMRVWEEAVLRCGSLCRQVHAHCVASSSSFSQDMCLNCPCRATPAACTLGGGGIAAAGARPALHGQLWSGNRSPNTSRSFATQRRRSPHRLQHLLAVTGGSPAQDAASTDATGELPLWRFLHQQGFSADGISRLQAAVGSGKVRNITTGQKFTAQKLQRDLEPNIAALRAEGLDTASAEQLFVQYPDLLTTTRTTFSSSLAALRQLAVLLPGEVGSCPNQPFRFISSSPPYGVPFSLLDSSSFHFAVSSLALSSAACLTPAEFDRCWREGGGRCLNYISCSDPAGRQRAAAEALGELLQAADGAPGPLQQQYRQQGEALVRRQPRLWSASPASLRASWASLQQLGPSGSQVAGVVCV